MESRVERLRIGPYRLVRQLQAGPVAERWLAFNELDETTHVAHRFRFGPDKHEQRRLVASIEAIAPLKHPHILPVEQFTLGVGGGAWVVTPYTGNLEGLVTLSALAESKGGRMAPEEAERALIQLLEAVETAHETGFHHGPLLADEVMVDRRGSLSIELYGLRRLLSASGHVPPADLARDEVRSIVGLGYWLITGLNAEEPRIRADRLVQKLDHRWDEWFDQGLDPMVGFGSAGEALSSLPGMRRELEPSPVRSVLVRFRRALGAT